MVSKSTLLAIFAVLGIAFALEPGRVLAQEKVHKPIPTRWTDEQIRAVVAPMRAGRVLAPRTWPNGARVAVCLSWDMDMETGELAAGIIVPNSLSEGEYGAREALPRIMELYDRYEIPGSFYIPAVAGLLYPEMVAEFKKRPQHEVGIHGWIHEYLPALNNKKEESRLLNKAVDFWSKALGKRPVGYRAPAWAFSSYTLELIRAAGFEYDSSAMAMDVPYELMANGKDTGIVELPISQILDDYQYLRPGGSLPSPELVYGIYRDEFDRAYQDGTLFILTMHPMVTGHRGGMKYLEELIKYMKSKPEVWFATERDIAQYVEKQDQSK
jgi:peptidoglycan-N-acetylglucosamine deacetylase